MVVLDCDSPPKILIGQSLGGGIVKEIKEVQTELLSASQLAKKYSINEYMPFFLAINADTMILTNAEASFS